MGCETVIKQETDNERKIVAKNVCELVDKPSTKYVQQSECAATTGSECEEKDLEECTTEYVCDDSGNGDNNGNNGNNNGGPNRNNGNNNGNNGPNNGNNGNNGPSNGNNGNNGNNNGNNGNGNNGNNNN